MPRVTLAFLLTTLLLGCYASFVSADRTPAKVTDPKVEAASKFALAELRKLCDYCEDDLRDTYQSMKLESLSKAETAPFQLSEGTMYFLNMELSTPKPHRGESKDSQLVIVFENKDGSYNGISMERSPFLEK
mmetsp:Transcript_19519/g.23400  ORF Transcript_19519/g.23400 Transcript_19519/m.23400 type:complete len:132 (-) Transcript_19519:1036-1431(-)|eukprot:CAMPEP_0197854202 /NCGR_PEP_ID=MMETSP1438-20131217/24234_1 /TAXON_ID=1461541 /ORGANISM="Pterosperma sp., Strain CCMP1384" /LENGTH=131 /DNA_ID=CAMNT_0043468859 /DNA_START=128 /DNA_END=523 /DNA_ORIENTATION=+